MMHSALRTIMAGFLLLCGLVAARGQEVRLHAAVAEPDGFVAVGEVFAHLGSDGQILDVLPLEVPLVSLASFGGRLYAIDSSGTDIIVMDGSAQVEARIAFYIKGRLKAVAAAEDALWAVTDAGEILRSADSDVWDVTDFNAQYDGFYPAMDFRAVAAGGGSILVAGVGEDGRPAAFVSFGSAAVWSERTLDYTAQGRPAMLEAVPAAASFDAVQDSFYLLCEGGVMFRLPACSHCNSLSRYQADTLYARVPLGFNALVLGSGGFRLLEKP